MIALIVYHWRNDYVMYDNKNSNNKNSNNVAVVAMLGKKKIMIAMASAAAVVK